ncbi:unnamed protein product, partial [Symbiodinium sp. CCMP2592]
ETIWRDDLQWDDDHWCFVHHSSGAPKEAGLLTCISKRLATPEGIRHSSIIAGRLQHLRITPKAGHQPIDLLHAYQFAWHHRKQDSKTDWWQDAMRRRAQFLQKLCGSLRSLPRRNLLCLTGDLNTQLASCKGVVGLGIPGTPPPQQDGQELLHTLCTFGLVATNTFGQAPGATFVNPATNAQTLIDYIILRGAHADGTSLASGPVQDWPVAMGRLGSRHIPVRGSFPFTWCPWVHSRPKHLTLKPRSVWEAVRNNPERQQAFRDKLRATLPHRPTIADIDRCLTQAWTHSQPAGARSTLAPAETAATVPAEATAVRTLWQLRNERDALTHRPPAYCLRAAFTAWRLDHQIRTLERTVVAERRARKKAFLLEQTALAERASQQGQLSALYRVVNRLAPRKVKARLQIRDPEGNLQDPQAECNTLLQYFRDLFASSRACPTQVFDCSVQLFDAGMCTSALASLSALKAAHPSASPGVLWKLAAQEVGPALSYVYRQLLATLGPQASEILTIYADDLIAQWMIRTSSDLTDCLAQLHKLVKILRFHGMEVSDTKSVILYQLHGTQAERTMGKLRFKDKGVSKLRVAPDCAFPIVRKHPYLGIILSYGALESHSITHRYNRAGQLFSRLRQVLSARHHLSRHTRRRLWLSTVWPCLKYGITALQLEAKDMVRIRGIVARHLRIVSGQLSKDTHVTTDAFLTELGFDPIALLSKEATANQTRFKALDRSLQLDRVAQWHVILQAAFAQPPVAAPQAAAPTPAPAPDSGATQAATTLQEVCFSAIGYVHMVLRFNVHVSSVHKPTDVLHVGTLRVARSFGSRCSLVSILICSLVQAMTMDVDQKLTHDQEEEREWEMYSAFMSTAITTAPSTTPKRPLEPPSKLQKTDPRQGKGKGKGKKGGGKGKGSANSSQTKDEEVAQLWTLCHMMIRLMVRHEDSIKTLMLDTSFVIWMRTGLPGGVPEGLFAVATKWKADRETTPPTSPLRLTLWMCVWREFLQRLQPARMTQEIQTNMKKLGFLTDEGKWNFLRWDPDQAKLIPDTTRPPLTAAAAIELVESVIRLATDSQLLTRFAPTRPLASELKGPSITFLASVSNRSTPSDQMHASLAELCGSACCQVIGMSIKPERLTRSPLAQQIYKFLPAPPPPPQP